tara:strand:+ start:642 stop:821 length:180 start_codon:yes stop_codon:yes gene_type:complete
VKRKVCDAVTYEGIYETIEEAVVAAKSLCESMETNVKITKCEEGYELFGNGEYVMTITE